MSKGKPNIGDTYKFIVKMMNIRLIKKPIFNLTNRSLVYVLTRCVFRKNKYIMVLYSMASIVNTPKAFQKIQGTSQSYTLFKSVSTDARKSIHPQMIHPMP